MCWKKEYVKLEFPISRFEVKHREAQKLKNENFPDLLYRYRSCNKLALENFQNDLVWMSNPIEFNDPYDTIFTYSSESITEDTIGKKCMQYLIKCNHTNGVELNEEEINILENYSFRECMAYLLKKDSRYVYLFEQVEDCALYNNLHNSNADITLLNKAKDLQKSLNVCCFSQNFNSILMWSHYSDFHRGFCLEYDFRDTDFQSKIEPVIYSDNIVDITDYIINEKIVNPFFVKYTAMRKYTDWKYEQEWRLIENGKEELKGYTLKLPSPKSIFLGCNISKWYETRLIKIAKAKSMKIYKMQMKPDKFELIPMCIGG